MTFKKTTRIQGLVSMLALSAIMLLAPMVSQAQFVQGVTVGYPLNGAAGDAAATLSGIQHFGFLPSGAITAGRTYTTATGTAICAQLAPLFGGQAAPAGFSWEWDVQSTSGAFTVTIAAGVGVTLNGTGTAATVTVRHFRWFVTDCASAKTLTLQSLVTSAF